MTSATEARQSAAQSEASRGESREPNSKKMQQSPSGSGPSRPGSGVSTRPGANTAHAQLVSEHGKTTIADMVVQKVAGLAAREIPGVHSMGSGMARGVGKLRSVMPGTDPTPAQGVAVEVGEREAAVDLDIVTWYGQSIADVSDAVRRNVIDRVEGMTGLTVVEVNISVDDIHVEGLNEDDGGAREQRVQ
ncbi:Asp23/Gls24 family envelope stress response protein [Pilimelia columellifera]|uniref:Asp23/Gls24 family envelope stress response protein n=1 Tax=Pilimelia columellifera subsp. columellifera TaxID=706583 RepID=A0ABP6B017_9ACTN